MYTKTKTTYFLKALYYLGIILSFFPCFVIFIIPNSGCNFYVGGIIWILLPVLLTILNKQRFLSFLFKITKTKMFKIYFTFLLFLWVTTAIHNIMGYSLLSWFRILFYQIKFFQVMLCLYLFPVITIYLNIKLSKVIKIFYIMLYVTFLLGIIQWFSIEFNIPIINDIIYFLTNSRYSLVLDNIILDRINSLQKEPSSIATLIYITLPFMVNLFLSKNKLFTNNYINILFKKTLLPLSFITLFLTYSPIYIIMCSIEFIILLIVRHRKRVVLIIFILSALFVFLFNLINNNNNIVISRITNVINSHSDISTLIQQEPSLATRIISYDLYLSVFKNNKFFGVGYYNAPSCASRLIPKYKGQLTPELLKNYYNLKSFELNSSILWKLLAEVGIIGTLLYFSFFIYNVKIIQKIKKCYTGLYFEYILGIQYSLIATLSFLIFYCVNIEDFIFNLIFGLSFMFYCNLIISHKTIPSMRIYSK